MSVRQLWTELEGRGVTLTAADGKLRVSAPTGAVTPELRQRLANARDELVAMLQDADLPADVAANDSGVDPRMEARRQRVLDILAENPAFRLSVVTDTEAEPETVCVHIGIRDIGSGEIVIAKGRYDGIELLWALENRQAE